MVALPHDAQRLLTRLREQDGLTQSRYRELYTTVRSVLQSGRTARPDLESIQEALVSVIGAADEKVALAQHLHRVVQHHVRHLEDEICCFEEEVRLARTHGELDEEPSPPETEPSPEPVEPASRRNSRAKRSRDETEASPRLVETAEFDAAPKRTKRVDPNATNEPVYCICNQVSFGEMIGCDNSDCEVEWFHYPCVGLSAPPPGKWYCPDCQARELKKGNHPRNRSQ